MRMCRAYTEHLLSTWGGLPLTPNPSLKKGNLRGKSWEFKTFDLKPKTESLRLKNASTLFVGYLVSWS